jgi:nucleoside-diphosphate-sugar epimerase
MKVLITGSTGMIGSHFVHACAARKWDVVGLARSTSAGRLQVNYDHRIVWAELLDRDSITGVLAKEKPE